MYVTPYDVCNQQCNDCLPLALALVLSLTLGHGVRPLNFAHCDSLRSTHDVIRDYEHFGACRGSPCDVKRFATLTPCPPAPRLHVEHNVSTVRLVEIARMTPLVASMDTSYPACTLSTYQHVVTVLGTRNRTLFVQNSYGSDWGDNGQQEVPVHRASECGMAHTIVYPVA